MDQNNEMSDGKLVTETSVAGMNSITNTVGMHPSTDATSPQINSSNMQRGSCDHPGCTTEHTVYTILENKRELAIATHNRAQDLDIAYNQQQDLIFQECLTTLGKLIEKYGQELNESSSASLVARFATLSALHRLDRNRRNSLVRLLYESKLITYRSGDYQPPILLYSTNLTDLNLHDGSDQGVFFHLSLEDTIMTKADFHESHIPGARFNKAILIHANPNLSGSNWRYAFCERCVFDQANLTNADLSEAIFIESDFRNCIITDKQLKQTVSLEHSILSIY